ncbi:hypothetical protein FHX44_112711 [Pseudonocardia hierapolitana]|uniref:Excalibur calcium-binding domain-containing protein n=1 Tax=Pseudonocardia hierapolitana TaxID=1128676 RepID=A0A561SPN5_9PSEU|nr:hypothetical protein [Pseudonocardia hierapolitana]TWF76813.1 hypothetical protein FHX44_112711 [Pseudonocardia hierapolitana]
MSVTRRTRLSLIAAAASGALVVTMAGTALASEGLDRPSCADLGLQDAEAALDAVAAPERLRVEDLCESIPALRSSGAADDDPTPETTPAAAPEEDDADGDDDEKGDAVGGSGDRDCADFDSQADAQAAFEESAGDGPERLDADDDDIACEDHFDTEDQQVAVYPEGGVATGGPALS